MKATSVCQKSKQQCIVASFANIFAGTKSISQFQSIVLPLPPIFGFVSRFFANTRECVPRKGEIIAKKPLKIWSVMDCLFGKMTHADKKPEEKRSTHGIRGRDEQNACNTTRLLSLADVFVLVCQPRSYRIAIALFQYWKCVVRPPSWWMYNIYNSFLFSFICISSHFVACEQKWCHSHFETVDL